MAAAPSSGPFSLQQTQGLLSRITQEENVQLLNAKDLSQKEEKRRSSMTDLLSLDVETPPRATTLDPKILEAFERLDKWKNCPNAPERLVYKHNRSRAASTGFPTILQSGLKLGLTEHEVAAVFGWTTGDYKIVNPIARGESRVEFEDYPFLPNSMAKVTCQLSRKDVMPYVDVLSSALHKLPAMKATRQILWRGHRRPLGQTTVGTTLVLKGFSSVSRDRDNALGFAEKANEGRSNKRALLAVVEHASSRCLAKLSARKNEVEVLFPRDTTFEVIEAPQDRIEQDRLAVQEATERLRKVMPDAEIELIYLREVTNDDWS